MVESGELKSSLGVSNYRPQDLELLLKHCKIKPVVNRPSFLSLPLPSSLAAFNRWLNVSPPSSDLLQKSNTTLTSLPLSIRSSRSARPTTFESKPTDPSRLSSGIPPVDLSSLSSLASPIDSLRRQGRRSTRPVFSFSGPGPREPWPSRAQRTKGTSRSWSTSVDFRRIR
jgi:hypothetical protein